MLSFKWKKTAIILADCLLAVYLVLAVTAFNSPDEVNNTCTEVKVHIQDNIVKGFLNADEINAQLKHARLFPLGDPMESVNARKIEDLLMQNPFVKSVQCYKTQTGRVHITLEQRMPIIRIKAINGEDYYIDEDGNVMPNVKYASNLVIATGHINHKYAQKVLKDFGRFLIANPLWRSQVEQFNILEDGSVEMVPRVGDHIVYLGQPNDLEKKLNRLEKFYKYGLSKAGWNKYSYINVEFDNQIICKKRKLQTDKQ
jgi:cell division protein FtsQ